RHRRRLRAAPSQGAAAPQRRATRAPWQDRMTTGTPSTRRTLMTRLSALVIFMLLASVSTGCATLVRGDKQKVKFQTNAPNATVAVDGKSYSAPAVVPLARKKPHTI